MKKHSKKPIPFLPNSKAISLSHTVGYKNHSVGYIFHSAGYKNHTVKQNYLLEKKQYACLRFYLYHTAASHNVFEPPLRRTHSPNYPIFFL